MKSLTERILKLAEFEEIAEYNSRVLEMPSFYSDYSKMKIAKQRMIGGSKENTRLLPLIKSLAEIIELVKEQRDLYMRELKQSPDAYRLEDGKIEARLKELGLSNDEVSGV